jgi:parallel beta-helix repeat protein
MTRIVRATRERSRWWLGLPLLAVVAGTLVLVQAAFSQPSAHRKATSHTATSARASTPPPYTCGETVSGSITLNADLNCPSGNGLIVGANSTTINLNLHTITGDPSGSSVGVLNGGGVNPGFSGVTVKSGTITGFFKGVSFGTLGGNVQVVKAVNNQQAGIQTNGTGTIIGNVVYGSVNGIVAGGSDLVRATITNNVVNDNSGDGIELVGGDGDVVSGNHVLSNGDTGIFSAVLGATFTANIANGNGTGMDLSSPETTQPVKASGNKAYFNDGLGIRFDPGGTDAGKNLASGNGTAHQCRDIVCSP